MQYVSTYRKDIRFLSMILILASLGCAAFVLFRLVLTEKFVYFFLVWNLFLAWVPYLLALLLMTIDEKTRLKSRRAVFALPVGFVWMLFFPNSPYIFTDFIHLINQSFIKSTSAQWITRNAIIWYDIILTSAFAFLGLFLGLISLFIVHGIARRHAGTVAGWLIVGTACLLSGFGIFVGRFIGLNSWDVFISPFETLDQITEWAFTPRGFLFSLTFAFFVAVTYVMLYVFKKVNVMRPESASLPGPGGEAG